MKFSTFKLALATPVIAVALSACGSSNGIADYEELVNKADAVIDRVKVVGDYNEETKEYQNITTAEEMSQRSGSATYTGVAGLWVADSEEILAQRMENDADPAVVAALNLTADFDSSSITGSMTNLQTNEEDMTVSGQIDLANGSISGGDLTADLTGTIETTGDGPDETLTLVGTTTGAFVGDNAEAAVGEIEATLSNGESDGSFVGGGWIVEEK
ncbi:transferrin-binding protein-like solute binding protein [Sulfitobacter sp. BSw21498]|uniref:transferrin-binding protein-like solute binding protein n=1 Tax=Sulfitobacter sp. BSw21498 TaxID=664426 RepID=UPI001110ABF0|nr:transferrin-binding protein-like solute binding protein [Sulfitobacter sp. BSw21498]